MQYIVNTLILLGFWFLLSGKTDLFYLAMGVLSAAIIAKINDKSHDQDARKHSLIQSLFQKVLYFVWLFKSILMAAIHVSRIILSRQMPIKPILFQHKTKLTSPKDKVLFANSITLTPGTITVDIQEDQLTIHELDRNSSEDIRSGAMEDRIQKINGGSPS